VDEEAYVRKWGFERKPASARNVDPRFGSFGAAMAADRRRPEPEGFRGRPQLAQFRDPDAPFMNLLGQLQRQSVDGGTEEESIFDAPDSSDDEVRCIPKVMQVGEAEAREKMSLPVRERMQAVVFHPPNHF